MPRFWMGKASVQLEFRRLNSSRLLSGLENVAAQKSYLWNPGVSAPKHSPWLPDRFSQMFFPMWLSTKAWPVWIMCCRFRSRFKMLRSCSVLTCTKSSTWITSQRWPLLPRSDSTTCLRRRNTKQVIDVYRHSDDVYDLFSDAAS